MKIDVTKGQCESVIDFIEGNILKVIRDDELLDNVDWLANILAVRDAMQKAVREDA